ncbi:MAG: osmotically inducible protein OsmC [Gammaproteobacteria bacterium RBG_16_66_13]|nr:MAG: osmotically inducible protein OsmC [Gammaproteobacteria bacterium RBG_16_66_13]
MKLEISFSGGMKVDAASRGFVVHTDQPVRDGGEGSAPEPFFLFLASMGTCAGSYVLSYMQKRGLPTQGVRLLQQTQSNPATGMVERLEIEILVPEGFPEKYLPAMIRSAETCFVKKHLEHPPAIDVTARTVSASIA